jgi:undecaprenyl diphosphate synthase
MNLLEKINPQNIPQHVAIIMDGNGRWAKKKGNQRIFGHKNAIQAVRDAVEAAGESGVKYLTLYAFSTENWNRPKAEVDALMSLLVSAVENETETLMKNNVRVKHIGNSDSLPPKVLKKLYDLIDKTDSNTGLTLILAISYSSRSEITSSIKKIAEKIKNNEISVEEITEKTITEHLQTKYFPDPDLLIRTSGELRISNFLMWQISYSELLFTDILWPDFRKKHFFEAIIEYQKRDRRFGKTEEQI